MGEVGQHILGHDFAGVNNHDFLTHLSDFGQDMRGQDNRMLASKLFNQGPDTNNLLRVKANRGLIQNEDARIMDNRLGQSHPLPIAF